MIQDAKQWNLGVSKLGGFMKYVREPFDEGHVEQFHGIVTILEAASGEDFSHFKISPDKLQPRIESAQLTTDFSSRPGRVIYSDKKYCDASYFRSQVDGLANYLPSIRGGRPANEPNPYDSLPDYQLQDMLINRKIKPKRIVDSRGERFIYDRAHAIAALLQADRPEPPPAVSNVFNIHDSNFVNSATGASITQNVGVKTEELRKVLIDLRQVSAAQEISQENRAQMNIDIGTIELQIDSQRPNQSIIRASLESARSILENAAGTVLGASAIAAIKYYLNFP